MANRKPINVIDGTKRLRKSDCLSLRDAIRQLIKSDEFDAVEAAEVVGVLFILVIEFAVQEADLDAS
jgi:hypothetical protein